METKKQQLYEKADIPKDFYPNNGITLIYDKYNETFNTSSTFEECLTAFHAGAIFMVVNDNNYKSKHIANAVYNRDIFNASQPDVDKVIIIEIHLMRDPNNIDIVYFIYREDNTKTTKETYILDHLQTIVMINCDDIINNLKSRNYPSATKALKKAIAKAGYFDEDSLDYVKSIQCISQINTIGDYGGCKVIVGWNPELSGIVMTWVSTTFTGGKIHVMSFTGNNAIGIASHVYDVIDMSDTSIYRSSPLNIDPITNPKIWVGTATQYAAIAKKDSNTTYVVKSDS